MATKKQQTARIIRWAVLALSAVFFLFFANIQEHVICPIGGFEFFFIGLFGTGITLAGIFSGLILIFAVMSILSIIFRRAYCGYICPMGALQELFAIVGKAVLPRKMKNARVPRKADRILRWVKYAVLIAVIAGVALTGAHWMAREDPFIVLMALFVRGGLATSWGRFPVSVIFFFAILVFSFFLGKGFCKYICPAGAWYAILSRISPTRVVRDELHCIGCGKCTKACPMNIEVSKLKSVTSVECIGCGECVNACPVKNVLSMKAGVSVPSVLIPIATAAAFSGSVALAVATMPARGPNGGHGGPGQNGGQGQNGGKPSASGGSAQTTDGTSSASIQNGAKNGTNDAAQKGKVSFGGCSNCSGCGICQLVSGSDARG